MNILIHVYDHNGVLLALLLDNTEKMDYVNKVWLNKHFSTWFTLILFEDKALQKLYKILDRNSGELK